METLVWWFIFFIAMGTLSFQRASLSVWTISFSVLLILLTVLSQTHWLLLSIFWTIFLIPAIILNCRPWRRRLITAHILPLFRQAMPSMSTTEKEALDAGTTGWETELFSGMPDWQKLQNYPPASLSEEEQLFMDGPVTKLCALIDNWQISRSMQVPEIIWQQLKQEGFFGLIIPKQYGGREFSATAHSQVIVKIASASVAVATIASVPNSLGPAELLLKFGTTQQKEYYLPRLARGDEIPCFALTSPFAGSDASAITDFGIVCKRHIDGREQLGILLNWDKRYITLAPVATLLGLAFKLYDPEHLLGSQEELGITCALVPTHLAGITIGRRHFPLHAAFPNGPTQGKDVFIAIDYIIGGPEQAGCGWRMLMECLAAGRSISLPSMVTGGMKRAILASGAYTRIRRQFNTALADFGGIQEALARMTGYSYLVEALRLFTLASLDSGEKSAIAAAISKYHTTELSRQILIDAMDIHGGKGICMGAKNYLAQTYIESPICITVEGANILTRSLIIFGQGAMRCHPYLLKEVQAVSEPDPKKALRRFDAAFFAHIGLIISNKVRTFFLGLTNGRLAAAPAGPLKYYYQQFSRFSAAFAFVVDVMMMLLGAQLKRKERLSARLGDLLSYLYIGSAVLKFYQDQKEKLALTNQESDQENDELCVVEWICQDLCYRFQQQMNSLFLNLPKRWVGVLLKWIVFPWGCHFKPPSDDLGEKLANLITEPNSKLRQQLAEHADLSDHSANPLANIEEILAQITAIEPLLTEIQTSQRKKMIKGKNLYELVVAAEKNNILTAEQAKQVFTAEQLRMQWIKVDDFSEEEIANGKFMAKELSTSCTENY